METNRSQFVSTRVLEAVAEAEGSEVLELDESILDAVNPDSLDDLFQTRYSVVKLEFEYHGYRVQIDEEGEVTLSEE